MTLLTIVQQIYFTLLAVLLLLSSLVHRLVWACKRGFRTLTSDRAAKDIRTVLLGKFPHHIGITLASKESSYIENLCQLVCWLASSKISLISIFDSSGDVSKSALEFSCALRRRRESLFPLNGTTFSVHAQSPSIPESSRMVEDNGVSLSADLYGKVAEDSNVCHVYVVGEPQSREDVVEATRSICRDVGKGVLKSSEISEALVGQKLWGSTLGDRAEPELVLSFGPAPSFYGIMPWHTRFSEILHMGSLKGLHYGEFLYKLGLFATKKQRFGT